MNLIAVQCPTCFEWFEISVVGLSGEVDYDCEVCCRPMVVEVSEEDAVARSVDDF